MIKIFTLIFLSLSVLASYLTYTDLWAESINVEEEKSIRSSYSSGFSSGSGGGYSYGK